MLWFPFLCCKPTTFAYSSPPATTRWTAGGPFQPKWGSDFIAAWAFIHSSAAWTELHVMRAFVKQHVLLRHVDGFRFLFIDKKYKRWKRYLNKVSHNLYSSHIKDLCLPFSEMSEKRRSVWENVEQRLVHFLLCILKLTLKSFLYLIYHHATF